MKTTTALVVVVAAMVLGGCASEAEAPDATDAPPAVETDTVQPAYGSGFSSNCYCSFCTKYCTTNGATYKSGTCC